MKLRWSAALGALACAVGVAACGEVPVLPQWDADWYLPLPSQTVNFNSFYSGPLPANTGFNWSPAPTTQSLSGAIGSLLKKDLRTGQVILTLRKKTQVNLLDSLFVGSCSTCLTAGNTGTILFVLSMQAADTIFVDTTVITPANVAMLSSVANANGPLWIKISGRASTGATPITITSADTMSVKPAMVARVAMSR